MTNPVVKADPGYHLWVYDKHWHEPWRRIDPVLAWEIVPDGLPMPVTLRVGRWDDRVHGFIQQPDSTFYWLGMGHEFLDEAEAREFAEGLEPEDEDPQPSELQENLKWGQLPR